VRTRSWQLESLTQQGDAVVTVLSTASDEASRKWWPYEFRASLRIAVGAELSLELIVTNVGLSPFQFEEALHTYNRVGDAAAIHIAGLDGVSYLDNRDANRKKLQQGDTTFQSQTDNAYLETQNAVEIVDPLLKRRIRLEKSNSNTTVVWNPWSDGAAGLADLGGDEWQQMACVEASNILAAAVHLAPGETHTLGATIRLAEI
jgi:glucose-6-phosphate 1-epimerase